MRSCGIRNVVPTMSMATGTCGPDGPTGDGGGITISEARISGEPRRVVIRGESLSS